MLTRLPKGHQELFDYWKEIEPEVRKIFSLFLNDKNEIVKAFEKLGLVFLNSKEIIFKCNCSRERMLSGIKALIDTGSSIESLFGEKDIIELKCDYCKTSYLITKSEIS
jgi:molecular chaperone Hsp33